VEGQLLKKYLIKRIPSFVLTILGITTVVFLLMRVIPGDPVQMMVPPGEITQEQIDRLRHNLGLDRPIYIQYVDYMSKLLTGDWGASLFGGQKVFPLIMHGSRVGGAIRL
jgi:ABC-type dipeptide/oligopeptide/nickel transport system permease component